MATLTGANLLDSILQSTGVTLNSLLTATLTARLQQMIDDGTDSNLAVSIAVSGFSTDINAATDVSDLSDTVAANVALIEAAEEGTVEDIEYPPYDGSTSQPQSFELTSDAAAINEDSTLTFTVTATNAVTEDTVVTFNVIPADTASDNAGTENTNLDDFTTGTLTGTATIAAGTTTATFTVTPKADGITELSENFSVKATVNGDELMVDATVLDGSAPAVLSPLVLTPSDDGSTMRLTGDQNVRIDFTDPSNQITGLDLDFDGIIEADGVENAVDVMPASNFIIVDAYSRDLLNEGNTTDNFLGDIHFDGTGLDADGTETNGNIFLGGLGDDVVFTGIGNDFVTGGANGSDEFNLGRNADFAFVELSRLDTVNGDSIDIDGGSTFDNNPSQDTDWLLLEASDDDEPVTVNLNDNADDPFNDVISRDGTGFSADEIENLNASGNLYGFLNAIDVQVGGNGKTVDGENVAIGSTAQLIVNGSTSDNIIIGGYDNDTITGAVGDDILFGGDMQFNQTFENNPNILGITNDGIDALSGGAGDDNIHFEMDGGSIDGGDDTDTLWLTNFSGGTEDSAGAKTIEGEVATGVVRIDLDAGITNSAGYGGADVEGTQDQTNYVEGSALRNTVTNMENVIATGLGAIDYDIDGANIGELDSTVQNYFGITDADLDLRGNDGSGDTQYTSTTTIFTETTTTTTNPTTTITFSNIDIEDNINQLDVAVIDAGLNGTVFIRDDANVEVVYEGVLSLEEAQVKFVTENPVVINFNAIVDDDYFVDLNEQTVTTTVPETVTVTLTEKGVGGDNILYANTGDDVLEGRGGDDLLSGGNGDDLFIFGTADGMVNIGDDVDVIHRQADADGDNIWDTDDEGNGLFEQDFGIGKTGTAAASHLDITIVNNDSELKVRSLSFWLDEVQYIVGIDELGATTNIGEVVDVLDTILSTENPLISVELVAGADADLQGIIRVNADVEEGASDVPEFVEVAGSAFDPDSVEMSIVFNDAEGGVTATENQGNISYSEDKLIYQSYEDRADGEKTNDDSFNGSNISLGEDSYAEDLVVNFAEDGTRIAEDQSYSLDFTNLTTQDTVTIMVNDVTYQLTVGIDIDGNIIDGEDNANGTSQFAIQAAFVTRMTDFINSFMDDDTSAGQVAAATDFADTIILTQADYNGEETVFMITPDVDIVNGSGGEDATCVVTNNADHEVHLLDFMNGDASKVTEELLTDNNVKFYGETEINRANLVTAAEAGEEINGTAAVLIDNLNDTHDSVLSNAGGDAIANNQASNPQMDAQVEIYSVHGDDLLIGGAGDDIINGGTGDDRIIGSLGSDTLDGGKDFYEVQILGEDSIRVYELNNYEANTFTLPGESVVSVDLIAQTEDGVTPMYTPFDDTLQFQQADFTPGVTEFTITLNDYEMNDGVVELQNDGAGTVEVDVDGDGVFESTTAFTNFENVRTVSGIGNAVAGDGQGNDTLNVSAMSTDTGGISYDLTNSADAGVVAYSADSAINVKALEAGQDAADLPGATVGTVKDAILMEQSHTPFNAAVDAIPLVVEGNPISIATFLAEVEALPELTRPTSVMDDLTDDPDPTPDISDYETTIIRVDGVEKVIGGDGNDLLLIDETEAAKDNLFDAGLGSDRIEYQNEYDATLIAEPTVTIKVNTALDTDEVVMTGGRVGTTVATDTLKGVEYITLAEDTAQSTREDDVIDVTAMTTGAVVDYVEEEVRDLAGNVQVVIENMFEMENVWADGDDTVIVADADIMSQNEHTDDENFDEVDIPIATFLDFDALDDETNARIPFAVNDDKAEVINFAQFTFDLSKTGGGNDTDTVDYSQALDSIATTVMRGENQYVMIDSDDEIDDGFQDVDNEDEDRVDHLIGVERIVASQAESVLDFTSMGEDVQISFQFDDDNADAATDTMENVVRIGDADGNTIEGIPNYIERFDLNDDDDVPAFNIAAWTSIEGGDYAESVFYDGSEDITNMGGVDHRYTDDELNLRGGDNNVSYYALETSINAVIEITEFDADDPLNTGLIDVTVDFEDGTGTDTQLPGAGTHEITSYTSDNGIAAGSLKLEATQDKEDSLFFKGDTTKLYILGTSPGVIDVGIKEYEDIDAMRLTGFEILEDAASDDAYDMESLENILGNLTLDDNTADDHDAIVVYDDAIGHGAVAADTIDLDELNTEFEFDFDVLDVTGVTKSGLTLIGATNGGPFSLESTPDTTNEVVVGSLAQIDTITDFASVVVTEDTVAAGTSFTLDLDAGVLSQGSIDVNFDGNMLSAGGLVLEDTYLDSYLNPLETGVQITLVADGSTGATLVGGDGDDEITGADGEDLIYGGLGADTLDGAFVAEITEKVVVTLSGGADTLSANDILNIAGVTVSDDPTVPPDINVTTGADGDQVGSAFETWASSAANIATIETNLGLNVGDLDSVSYDGNSNNLIFNFTSQAGDVAAATVTVDNTGVTTGTLTGTVFEDGSDASTQSVAYAAQGESSDTFVYLTAAESTEASMDQISNFTIDGGAANDVDDKLDISAIMDDMAADGTDAFSDLFAWNNTEAVTFEELKAEANVAFADGYVGYAGSTGEDAEGDSYVFLDANENGEYDAADGVVELTGIAHNDFVGAGFGSDNLILV